VLLQHGTTRLPIPASTNIEDTSAQKEQIVQELPKAILDQGPTPISANVVASPVAAEATPKVGNENETANKSAPVGDPAPRTHLSQTHTGEMNSKRKSLH
jgi:hypothetical protein